MGTRAIISDLIGKTFVQIQGGQVEDEEMVFLGQDNFRFFHSRDCCENVRIVDLNGDLDDLVGTPILEASEVSDGWSDTKLNRQLDDSHTWTFYRFTTIKGTVVVRWLGESNGYYSESVDIERWPSREA